MKKVDFVKYATLRIFDELSDIAKYMGRMNIESDLRSVAGANITSTGEDKEVSRSFINHFDKLINDLKKTSNKKLLTPCALCDSEYLKPIDQQFEVYKAIKAFIKVAINRDKHGIRNAYISFTRQRKQRLVKSEGNPEGARRGRPNIYESETYRYVVNRAAKLNKAKKSSKS